MNIIEVFQQWKGIRGNNYDSVQEFLDTHPDLDTHENENMLLQELKLKKPRGE